MRTIAEALAPYERGQNSVVAMPHQHCIDQEAVENGLMAVEQDLATSPLLGDIFRSEEWRTAFRESFWEGVQEWKDAK